MKALLLAAGLGTRLRPVTNHVPKCMVPIHGKPLLQYWLENLSKAGVTEFLINTHYLSKQVEEFIENSQYKDQVRLVYEEELLLTGGTILKNKEFFEDESFFVVHADNLSFCDFSKFIQTHKNRPEGCECTMMTFETDVPESCGIVKCEDNIVTEFHEKVKNPPSNLANGAVYIFEPTIIDLIASYQKEKVDLSTQIIPKLMNRIVVFHNDVYHRDIGNLESYSLSQIEIMDLI